MIALVVAAGMNLFTYWNSDRMVLRCTARRRSTRAPRPSSTRWCSELARRAGLPMPRVYLIDNPQPNAFATGRNPAERRGRRDHRPAATCSTREEVAGVMAHELAHVKNRDTLTMTITATIAGAISMLAQFGMFFGGNRDNNNRLGIIGTLAMMILAPLAAMLVQMAISRTREYEADRCGAEISGKPLCARLGAGQDRTTPRTQIPNETAERNPATAHLFIINPLSGARHGQSVLDPPGDREPHRRAGAAGAADGPRRPATPRRSRAGAPAMGRGGQRRGPWG